MNIIIFSTKKHKIGDSIQLGNRQNDRSSKGVVIGLCEDNPKYKGHKVCGHKELVNTGKDYYYVEIRD